jgi:hypothetical protein
MRGKDLFYFIFWFVAPLSVQSFYCPTIEVSDVITFLSIIIGFQATSLSIIFNSKILNQLFISPDSLYRTQLHRLSSYYKFSIIFESLCVVGLLISGQSLIITKFGLTLHIEKNWLIPSILFGTLYCMYKIGNDLFKIFELPRNE